MDIGKPVKEEERGAPEPLTLPTQEPRRPGVGQPIEIPKPEKVEQPA